MLGHVVTMLRGTVLSHPHIREAIRKGEVIKKVKPKKGGVSTSKFLRTPTLQWHPGRRVLEHKQETHRTDLCQQTFSFTVSLTALIWSSYYVVTIKNWILFVVGKRKQNPIKIEDVLPFGGH